MLAYLTAMGVPAVAGANVTLPGANGLIAFASDRDAPAPPPSPSVAATQNEECDGAPEGDTDCEFDIFTVAPSGDLATVVNLTRDQPGENNAKDDKPSWSPDGTQIAFESRRDCVPDSRFGCQADIYVMNSDGTNVRRLTFGPESDTHPTWSPDGATIAFERGDLLGDDPDRIFTVPAAGGAAPQEVDTGANALPIRAGDLLPAWSPDGRQIAFTRIELGSFDARSLSATVSGLRRRAADQDLGEMLRSGDVTALQVGEGEFAIHTYVHTIGGSTEPLGGESAVKPCSLQGGGEGSSQLTCTFDLNPAWSPDGGRIAFHRLQLNLGEGFSSDDADVVSSTPAGVETVLNDEGECQSEGEGVPCVDDYKPAFSPDGALMAFHSDRGAPGCFLNDQGSGSPIFGSSEGCRPQLFLAGSGGGGVTGPLAPASNGQAKVSSIDRNADWQRVIPVTPTPAGATTAPARRDTRRPRVSASRLRACTSSRRLRIPVRIAERGGIRRVTVTLDGKRILTTKRQRFTLTVNARRLRPGRHRLRIVAVDASGNRTTVDRVIARCAQRPRQRRAPAFTG